MGDEFELPTSIDPSTPNVARMYDFVLGGKDNFAADREAAGHLIATIPDGSDAIRANRRFLGRAVDFVAKQGVTQFVDLGSGLPNLGNVHEIAQRSHPHARVVYVDIDPIVIAHAGALLTDDAQTIALQADLRRPSSVLDHPEVRHLIDFSRPIGVLFNAMLHFVTDDQDPEGIVGAFVSRMAPGSFLVISHITFDDRPAEQVAEIEDTYKKASAPIVFRDHAELTRLFCGLDLVEPGLVKINRWRPDDLERRAKGGAWVYGGVGTQRSA